MIISKANLEIRRIASLDREVFVQIEPNGRTTAVNKKCGMVVSAVTEKVAGSVPLKRPVLTKVVTMGLEQVNEVAKAISKDTLFGGLLEHAAVEFKEAENEVTFTVTDGKHEKTVRGRDMGRRLDTEALLEKMRQHLSWAQTSESIHQEDGEGGYHRIFALNRKRLMIMLDVIDKAFPDTSGESPIWMVIGKDGIMVVGIDYRSGQTAAGLMKAYKGEGTEIPAECMQMLKRGDKPVSRISKVGKVKRVESNQGKGGY